MIALVIVITFILEGNLTSTYVITEDAAPALLVFNNTMDCYRSRAIGINIAKNMIADGRLTSLPEDIRNPTFSVHCVERGAA